MELPGNVGRLLARGRIGYQQDLLRTHRLLELDQFLHQRLVDLVPACGVEDQNVPVLDLGQADCLPGDARDVELARLSEDRDVDLLAERLELLDCGRAVNVARDEHRAAALRFEPEAELGRGRGLARAVEADEQYSTRRAGKLE